MYSMKPFKLPVLPEKNFDGNNIDPLDGRYYDAETTQYLSEATRIAYQAHVEVALAFGLAKHNICSKTEAMAIEQAALKLSPAAVYEEEKTTKHDIKALVNCLKKLAGKDAAAYVHFGATSYDIVATASSLQLKNAVTGLIVPRLDALLATLVELTEKYASTLQVGRTHGQHAVPITFGFAIAEYVERIGVSRNAIQALADELPGKFSGAVGAYNALDMFIDDPVGFENDVLEPLGLRPAPYSTQVIPPEYVVRLIDEIQIVGGIMANLAHDMRHLQRSEIAEVAERFEKGQTGSSTMAHKRNPWNFENVVSMNKQLTAQLINANLNLASEHQRDLTDSAAARFYSIALAVCAEMAARLNRIMSRLEVDEPAMQRNLKLLGGAIAAEPLYLLFAKYGLASAHETSKALAHKALETGKPLHEVVASDEAVSHLWEKFTEQEKLIIQNPEQHYHGIAEQKALLIAKKWKDDLNVQAG